MSFRIGEKGSQFKTSLYNGILKIYITEKCVLEISIPKLEFLGTMEDNTYVYNPDIVAYLENDNYKVIWTTDSYINVYESTNKVTPDGTRIWHRIRVLKQEIPTFKNELIVLRKGLLLLGEKGKNKPLFLPIFYICNNTQEIVMGFSGFSRRFQFEPKNQALLVKEILTTEILEPCLNAIFLGKVPKTANEKALAAVQSIYEYPKENSKHEYRVVITNTYQNDNIISLL